MIPGMEPTNNEQKTHTFSWMSGLYVNVKMALYLFGL